MQAVIGIDEVGRGPLAGPVAVGAFHIFSGDFFEQIKKFGVPLRDSKQLSKVQRESWFKYLFELQEEGMCDFAVCMVSAKEIDAHGISKAIKKALSEALDLLEFDKETFILLDGSLHAPPEYKNQITIIKGDEKEVAIALASIVAKVTRDNHMTKLAQKYPKYGFEQHSGYGTEAHYNAIKKYGPSPHHRKSFLHL